MCHTHLDIQSKPHKRPKQHLGLKHSIVFIFIATMSLSFLVAQSNSEEYASLRSYQIPQNAVQISQLQLADSLYTFEGQLFSGVAYEQYPNEELKSVIHIYQGQLHGLKYMWYLGFKPAMNMNYYLGRARGRLMGWYLNGKILYDMIIGPKGAGMNMLEPYMDYYDDQFYDTEQEGRDND